MFDEHMFSFSVRNIEISYKVKIAPSCIDIARIAVV